MMNVASVIFVLLSGSLFYVHSVYASCMTEFVGRNKKNAWCSSGLALHYLGGSEATNLELIPADEDATVTPYHAEVPTWVQVKPLIWEGSCLTKAGKGGQDLPAEMLM